MKKIVFAVAALIAFGLGNPSAALARGGHHHGHHGHGHHGHHGYVYYGHHHHHSYYWGGPRYYSYDPYLYGSSGVTVAFGGHHHHGHHHHHW